MFTEGATGRQINMDRTDVGKLLARRSTFTSQPYGEQMIDSWHEQLLHVDYGEGVVAMSRACRAHERVHLKHFLDALHEHQVAKRNRRPEPQLDCPDCGGYGWAIDDHTNRAYRCEHTRRSEPVIPYEQGVAIAMRERDAERARRAARGAGA